MLSPLLDLAMAMALIAEGQFYNVQFWAHHFSDGLLNKAEMSTSSIPHFLRHRNNGGRARSLFFLTVASGEGNALGHDNH